MGCVDRVSGNDSGSNVSGAGGGNDCGRDSGGGGGSWGCSGGGGVWRSYVLALLLVVVIEVVLHY